MKKLLNIFSFLLCFSTLSFSQTFEKIELLEYFFDADPGHGNGTQVPVGYTDHLDTSLTLSVVGLTPGLHHIYFRAFSDSAWSITNQNVFWINGNEALPNITELEYFYDIDPGFGNGTPVSITSGTAINETFTASVASLSDGFHIIYLRAKDQNGVWGETFTRPFIVGGNEILPNLVEGEYFFDTDPGYGAGTPLTFTSGTAVDFTFNADYAALSPGLHMMYTRFKDDLNHWGHTHHAVLMVGGSDVAPEITRIEYFFDTDPGFGLATSVSFTPNSFININPTLDLSSATAGIHHLYIRAQNALGAWSQTFSRTFFVSSNASPNLKEIQYSFDSVSVNNPVYTLPVNTSLVVDSNLVFDVSALSRGHHRVYMKAVSEVNSPSEMFYDNFCVWSKADFVVEDTVCANSPVDFTDASIDTIAGTDYFWDFNSDGTFEDLTKGSVTFTYPSAGTYAARLIHDKDSSCADTVSHTVVVIDNTLNAAYNGSVVCVGNSTSIIDISTGTDSNTLYSWDIYNDGSIDNNTQGTFSYTFPTSGFHDVKLVLSQYGVCFDSVTSFVFVDTASVDAYFTADTACIGNATVFTDLSWGTNSSTTYKWDINNDGSIEYTTQGSISHTFANVGTYTVELGLNTGNICPDYFLMNVVVDSLGVIEGQVTDGAAMVNAGKVKLFKIVAEGEYPAVDSAIIKTDGTYVIHNVSSGNYLLQVFPDTTLFPGTVNTYYGGVFQWENATVINHFCDEQLDIELLNTDEVLGIGTLSGTIQRVLIGTAFKSAVGDPIPGVDISIEQIPGGIFVKQTETDASGYYEFTNLPNKTYQLWVDIPGLEMDSTYTVTIDANGGTFTNLNFIVDSAKIYIAPMTSTIETSDLNSFIAVYPNPFSQWLKMAYTLDRDAYVQVSLYNGIGQLLLVIEDKNQVAGTHALEINAADRTLSSGMYFLKVQINEEQKIFKLSKN